MKSFSKALKRQDGFTLVELMVVVAIIGLLSAVAVPNFKKYQAKAKMSEAKLQLSAIYTAESSFYSDYNIYAQCLVYMGYDPGLEWANRYYAVGFRTPVEINGTLTTGAYGAAINSGLQELDCPIGNNGPDGADLAQSNFNPTGFFPAGKGIGASRANTNTFLDATATTGTQATQLLMTFTAGAGGVISIDNPIFGVAGTSSYLEINERKVIRVLRNGF
jgi:prepilin-type N-terminal cleavage/methylation domain-containing protein